MSTGQGEWVGCCLPPADVHIEAVELINHLAAPARPQVLESGVRLAPWNDDTSLPLPFPGAQWPGKGTFWRRDIESRRSPGGREYPRGAKPYLGI